MVVPSGNADIIKLRVNTDLSDMEAIKFAENVASS